MLSDDRSIRVGGPPLSTTPPPVWPNVLEFKKKSPV